MGKTLDALMVNAICKSVGEMSVGFRGSVATVHDLCGSHEALRIKVTKAEAERAAAKAECERLRRGLDAMRAIYQDGTMASNAALDAINEAVANLLAGREWSDDGSVKP